MANIFYDGTQAVKRDALHVNCVRQYALRRYLVLWIFGWIILSILHIIRQSQLKRRNERMEVAAPPVTTSTWLSVYTVASAKRHALWMPSWRVQTSSSPQRRTRSCYTTRRSCWPTGTSGRWPSRRTWPQTSSTDKRTQRSGPPGARLKAFYPSVMKILFITSKDKQWRRRFFHSFIYSFEALVYFNLSTNNREQKRFKIISKF